MSKAPHDFLRGLGLGAALTLALLGGTLLPAEAPVLLEAQTLLAQLPVSDWQGWLRHNLGYSLLPFGLTALLFLYSLARLQTLLNSADTSPDRIAQLDQLSDIWIGLFFGIGVLWTAIGMRSALLYGLGDGAESMAAAGPGGLLERLVHGGILTALTTTIVGGGGGYLMRLYKAARVGGSLKRYYAGLEQQRKQQVEGLLQDIRDRLPEKG